MSNIKNNEYDEFGFFNPFSVNDEKSEDDTSQSGAESEE